MLTDEQRQAALTSAALAMDPHHLVAVHEASKLATGQGDLGRARLLRRDTEIRIYAEIFHFGLSERAQAKRIANDLIHRQRDEGHQGDAIRAVVALSEGKPIGFRTLQTILAGLRFT